MVRGFRDLSQENSLAKSFLLLSILILGLSSTLTPGGVLTARGQPAPQTPLIFYYHNETSDPLIAGYTRATTVLNTTTNWSVGPQLWPPSSGSFTFLFYQTPNLAAPITLNGTIALHPWVSGNTTGGSTPSGSFRLTIYEVATTGFIWSSTASGPGSVDVASSPADVNKIPTNAGKQLVYNVGAHTFATGDSLAIGVTASPGSTTSMKFYYDAVSTPSYVELFSSNHASIANIWYTDEFANPASSFVARDVGILTVNAIGMDPLGMYDAMVSPVGGRDPSLRLDILAPSGMALIANVSMVDLQGTPTGLNGTFAFTLNIPDISGSYPVAVRIVDNSGNIFTQTALLLIIEGFPLTVRVGDSNGQPISGAWVQILTASGIPYDSKQTNSSGIATFKVPGGSYQVHVSYTTTFMLTPFSSNIATSAQSVSSPKTLSLQISSYPPPFSSTVLYSLILWGVVLLLVLVGVIIAVARRSQVSSSLHLLSKSVKRTSSSAQRGGETTRFCIYCGSPLGAQAGVCGNCGKTVPKTSIEVNTPGLDPPKTRKAQTVKSS